MYLLITTVILIGKNRLMFFPLKTRRGDILSSKSQPLLPLYCEVMCKEVPVNLESTFSVLF